uniref:Transmembrane protein n=1 Tax=Strombidium inclinatum TaxID=197538 RepID=A0A7S3ICR1_9SPIT
MEQAPSPTRVRSTLRKRKLPNLAGNRYASLVAEAPVELASDDQLALPLQYGKQKKRVVVSKTFEEDNSLNESSVLFEGGRGEAKISKSGGGGNNAVKDLFHQTDVLGHEHLQNVGAEMQKHGSKEKTGFMQKEANFVKNLKQVQQYHVDVCISLMRISIFVLALQFCFACVQVFHFGCIAGDCPYILICFIHYIKFCQTLFLINTYWANIKEKQPNHPIGTLNTFLVILLYYGCFYYKFDLVEAKYQKMIHFCAAYPATDLLLIIISFIRISQVKAKARNLTENKEFKEYNQEAEIALADILYLPQEFESDDAEEDF